jgi:hypothetical protein
VSAQKSRVWPQDTGVAGGIQIDPYFLLLCFWCMDRCSWKTQGGRRNRLRFPQLGCLHPCILTNFCIKECCKHNTYEMYARILKIFMMYIHILCYLTALPVYCYAAQMGEHRILNLRRTATNLCGRRRVVKHSSFKYLSSIPDSALFRV